MTVGLNQFNVTSLSPDTGYVAYFVAEDTSGNLQSTVTSKTFATLSSGTGADTTPPAITETSLTGVTSTGAMLNLTSSESGTIFSVALLSGATAPTAVQIKA